MKKLRFNERLVRDWLRFGTAVVQLLITIVNAFINYLRLHGYRKVDTSLRA